MSILFYVASIFYSVGIIILTINDNGGVGFTIIGILTYILYFVSSYNIGVVS